MCDVLDISYKRSYARLQVNDAASGEEEKFNLIS